MTCCINYPFKFETPRKCFVFQKMKNVMAEITVWKFKNVFRTTQILREINCERIRVSKTAIWTFLLAHSVEIAVFFYHSDFTWILFCNFWASNFCSFGQFQPSKSAKIHKNQNSEPLHTLNWQILQFQNPKIDFT